jgi:hypothetical protein
MLFKSTVCNICGKKKGTLFSLHQECIDFKNTIVLGTVMKDTLRFIGKSAIEKRLLYYKEI